MIIQIKKTAFEPLTIDLVGPKFRSFLLNRKMEALRNGMIIPDDFIAKLENFKERNAVEGIGESYGKVCCTQCLKAYALKKAEELGLGKKAIGIVEKMLEGKTGHNGYFMDGDELVRI
jgi:hypothetical protein